MKNRDAKQIIAENALIKPVFCFQCKHFVQNKQHAPYKIGKCNLYDCMKKEVGYCDKGETGKEE